MSSSPDVLGAVGRAAQPLGHLLFQVESPEDLALRLRDLQPAVVVLDADAHGCEDCQAIGDAFESVEGQLRPQVLLVGGDDDARRERLVELARADVLIDRPIDQLEVTVEIRTLVRVRRLNAEAVRDRDLLEHLLELTTFADGYTTTDAVLESLAQRVASWLGFPHVVVTLGGERTPRIVASAHAEGSHGRGRSLVERRHHELQSRRELLMVGEADGVMMGEDPTALPYVGIPLVAQDGDVVGALHAWGGGRLPSEAHRRVLQVAASRIGTEIRLHDQQRRLEEMVETRTADLTALLERLRGKNNQLVEASRETIMRLARAAEYRDGDTGEHVDRMSSYSQVVARRMGMSPDEIALIKLAAPMHDVGKIGIPDAILLKNGKLTPEEYEVMKQHPLIGARILSGSHSQLLRMAEQIAATHHEKWDGSGYPLGLAGNEIPLAGRIVALADVFDALTSPRVYKDAWSIDESVAYVRGLSGTHFDPRVVDAFMACLDELLEIRASYVGKEPEPLAPAEVMRVGTTTGEAAA
ncbi:MAG: Cyclic di-GMP phosphodiesterase response regulator RpfG [Pseudomonadota bacterium]|jgi:response regulator RpfG family c-di-GMP phosphodiesterase